MIGSKASVLIKPSLLINGRLASLELVRNGKVTLTTMSYVDSIPVTKNFENLRFSDARDCILDFQVPSYLQSVSVTLECEVPNLTQGSNQKFNVSQSFQIATHSGGLNMCELFLRKEKGGEFCAYVLGKNGEPR